MQAALVGVPVTPLLREVAGAPVASAASVAVTGAVDAVVAVAVAAAAVAVAAAVAAAVEAAAVAAAVAAVGVVAAGSVFNATSVFCLSRRRSSTLARWPLVPSSRSSLAESATTFAFIPWTIMSENISAIRIVI